MSGPGAARCLGTRSPSSTPGAAYSGSISDQVWSLGALRGQTRSGGPSPIPVPRRRSYSQVVLWIQGPGPRLGPVDRVQDLEPWIQYNVTSVFLGPGSGPLARPGPGAKPPYPTRHLDLGSWGRRKAAPGLPYPEPWVH